MCTQDRNGRIGIQICTDWRNPTIEEYVNHLNKDCDDLLYYVLDDNDYAHMMNKSEYDDWMAENKSGKLV